MRALSAGAALAVCLSTCVPCRAGDIHDAARVGHLETVKSILALDPKQLNAGDAIGHTPLTLSAAYGRWQLFLYLLNSGADVNVVTRSGQTPLHCACQHDRVEMVELLFEKGAEPSMEVTDVFGGYTPMLRAVQRGNRHVVALLFEKGARSDEKTKEGWNALHLAAKCGHRHLYGLLIEKGVSLDAVDRAGKKPIEYDFRRPDPIEAETSRYPGYVGRFTWQGTPDGPGVEVFIEDGELTLDDNSLNRLYPIGEDTFYCRNDPWRVRFLRDDTGRADRVELTFLRRSVTLVRAR